MEKYDIAIAGGGIGGSALARCMAAAGARVLLLEMETEFKDRVRGEVLVPWGVAEAKALGMLGILLDAGARELHWLDQYMGPQQIEHRDFVSTTPSRTPVLTIFHPRMQQALLDAAIASGVTVRRGAIVNSALSGVLPQLTCSINGHSETIAARLIVVADGRGSRLRSQAGFEVKRETHSLCIAGVLLESVSVPAGTFHMFTNPALGEISVFAPQGNSRARVYLCFWREAKRKFQGSGDLARLIADLEWTGVARQYFATAKQAGPLATFEGADHWTEHPYRDGIALLGDAAACSDPAWGQGLSLTLRGARVMRDALLRNPDWNAAAHEYAAEVDCYYGKVRTVAAWLREFFLVQGEEADGRRAHALPLIGQDATRVPDLLFSGPDIPLAENARERFFGEDQYSSAAAV